jgi:VanZ family protein
VAKIGSFTILFISWVILITGLSLFDFNSDEPVVEVPNFDKLVHFTFYFGFVVFGWLALKQRKSMHIALKNLLALIGVAIFFGMLIEVLQYALPVDRAAEFFDILANTLGAIAGGLLIKTYISRSKKLK